MNTATKARWISDLRRVKNGYAQGTGMLYREEEETYCCLGVLAKDDPLGYDVSGNNYQRLREDFGLTEEEINTLVSMNDSEEKTFRQIARWVDKNVVASPDQPEEQTK
jgi:hypothetical protein